MARCASTCTTRPSRTRRKAAAFRGAKGRQQAEATRVPHVERCPFNILLACGSSGGRRIASTCDVRARSKNKNNTIHTHGRAYFGHPVAL
eukprot:2915648-Prymnesium_polylepis.1